MSLFDMTAFKTALYLYYEVFLINLYNFFSL